MSLAPRKRSIGRPIRVLDFRDTDEIGGPGKTIIETFRAIDRTRFDLHLAVFLRRDESEDTPFLRASRACGMPVHVIRGYNQYDPRLLTRAGTLVRRLGIDIVHAHEVKSDVITYLLGRAVRVKTMTTVHGWIANDAKQRLMAAIDRRLLPSFDRVLVVSEQIRDELRTRGVSDRNMLLLHNAIVLENYRRTGARGFLREILGREPAGPVIASIGRLSPEKGHADMIQALATVRRQGCAFTAVLAGDGPSRGTLEAEVRALGLQDCVFFAGYVERPDRILEETDLLMLPSHTEGLPNAALEAMAMEVPLLATAVGGTPEVATDGVTARLVPARNPGALAAGTVHFLAHRDVWRGWAAEGRRRVEARFNFATRTQTLQRIYAELCGGTAA